MGFVQTVVLMKQDFIIVINIIIAKFLHFVDIFNKRNRKYLYIFRVCYKGQFKTTRETLRIYYLVSIYRYTLLVVFKYFSIRSNILNSTIKKNIDAV